MDVRGALGVSDEVRNGFTRIRVRFKVKGDAPAEKLREVVERAQARSAVFDMVSNGVPVEVGVVTTERAGGRGTRPGTPASTETAMFELTARPSRRPPGRLAESLADEFATRAAARPRGDVSRSRASTRSSAPATSRAPVPAEHGGLGVASVHDLLVASSRLARGDASVAIGVNMHLAVAAEHRAPLADRRRRRRRAPGRGFARVDGADRPRRRRASPPPSASSGQDLTRPAHHARRAPPPAGGSTGARRSARCRRRRPCSTPRSRFADDDGVERYGYAQVPTDAPGVTIHDDWDALGMRASGSQLGELRRRRAARARRCAAASPPATRRLHGAQPRRRALPRVGVAGHRRGRARRRPPGALARAASRDARARTLAVGRSTVGRARRLPRAHAHRRPPRGEPDDRRRADELTALFAEAQAAKAFVNEAAARVVDRALALSGGAGYLNGHPLARAYRDVRAGGFMHPLGANRAYDLLADVALGREPRPAL